MTAALKQISVAELLATRAQTLIGPIPEAGQAAIMAYLLNPAPTREAWKFIRCMLISSNIRRGTLWQAIAYVDNSCPVGDSVDYVPDPFTVARAIRAVLDPREPPR